MLRFGRGSVEKIEWAPSAQRTKRARMSRPSAMRTPATRPPSRTSVVARTPPSNDTPCARARSSKRLSNSRRSRMTALAFDESTIDRPPGVTILTDSIFTAWRWRSAPIPSSSARAIALGERPEPHVFSRGKVARSSRRMSFTPRCASATAADAPAGPAPTMTTSWVMGSALRKAARSLLSGGPASGAQTGANWAVAGRRDPLVSATARAGSARARRGADARRCPRRRSGRRPQRPPPCRRPVSRTDRTRGAPPTSRPEEPSASSPPS